MQGTPDADLQSKLSAELSSSSSLIPPVADAQGSGLQHRPSRCSRLYRGFDESVSRHLDFAELKLRKPTTPIVEDHRPRDGQGHT
jgi:hypothetical protein